MEYLLVIQENEISVMENKIKNYIGKHKKTRPYDRHNTISLDKNHTVYPDTSNAGMFY